MQAGRDTERDVRAPIDRARLVQRCATAPVVVLEAPGLPTAQTGQNVRRAQALAGKRSVVFDPGISIDVETLARLLPRVDIVLSSSDQQPAWINALIAASKSKCSCFKRANSRRISACSCSDMSFRLQSVRRLSAPQGRDRT